MKTQYGEVAVAREGHVAVLEISRPPNNHVSVGLMRELANALDDIDAERELRATVLTTAGKVFCAGADLNAPGDSNIVSPGAGPGINALYVEAVRLFSAKKPIVAAVQGAAVGAGLGLALVADFRVAAPEARFTANFTKLGFHPGFGITHTLPFVIGQQRASLMCLTGRRIKAEEALTWGLVDEIAPFEQLRGAALKLAQEIAEAAPLAVQSTRATLRAGLAEAVKKQTDHEFVEQTWLRKTKDFAEGVRSVAERRPGNFTGT
ncbi:MAG: enoyl-CoA hydratase/isomerase family protein [Alphaproteobacteria bacterium]|nr:enoyl-CoA hydratase/isomerase family protein [Alphaproteobacteria bacterium]